MPNGLVPPFITKFNKDLYEFIQRRPDVPIESLQHATPEIPYPLDNARDNEKIHDRSGDRIFVTTATGIAYFRVNSPTGPLYKLRVGSIQIPFETIYLTNAAQAGKSVSIIIGYEAFIEFASANYIMKILNVADGEINPATEDKQDTILTEVQKLSLPVSIHDTSTGAGLSLTLEVGPRKFIEIWVKSSAAATFKVYDKREGGAWKEADEIELTGAGEIKLGYWNSLPWIKVATTDANNNEIEIAGS